MILGNDAIILSRDDAEILLKAVYSNWDRETIERLGKIKALGIVGSIQSFVKEGDPHLRCSGCDE